MQTILALAAAATLAACGGSDQPTSCSTQASDTFSAVYVVPVCTELGTSHRCTVAGVSGECA